MFFAFMPTIVNNALYEVSHIDVVWSPTTQESLSFDRTACVLHSYSDNLPANHLVNSNGNMVPMKQSRSIHKDACNNEKSYLSFNFKFTSNVA